MSDKKLIKTMEIYLVECKEIRTVGEGCNKCIFNASMCAEYFKCWINEPIIKSYWTTEKPE